jgi:chromosome segregation ATPase
METLNKIQPVKLGTTTKINGIKYSLYDCDASNKSSSLILMLAAQINEISADISLAKTRIESFDTILQEELRTRESIIELLEAEKKNQSGFIGTLYDQIEDWKHKLSDLSKTEQSLSLRLEGFMY